MRVDRAVAGAGRLGIAIEQDPLTGLLSAVHQSAGRLAFWAALAGELRPAFGGAMTDVVDDESVSAETKPKREWREGVAGPDHKGDGRPHVFVAQYNEALVDHARICKLALDAGIAERQVRIAEEQAVAIASTIARVLRRLGVPATAEALQIVREELAAAAAPIIELEGTP